MCSHTHICTHAFTHSHMYLHTCTTHPFSCTHTLIHSIHPHTRALTHTHNSPPPACTHSQRPHSYTYLCMQSQHTTLTRSPFNPVLPSVSFPDFSGGPELTFTENLQGVRQWVLALSTSPRDSLPGWVSSPHYTDVQTEPTELMVSQELVGPRALTPFGTFCGSSVVFLCHKLTASSWQYPQGQDHVCSFSLSPTWAGILKMLKEFF